MIPKINGLSTWIADNGIEAKAQSLATINAIADTVYRHLDLQALVENAVNVILEYIPVTSVALFLLDESGEWLNLTAWRGFTEKTLEVGSRLPVNASLTGLTITQQDIIVNDDIANSSVLEPRGQMALGAQGLTGCISIQLLSQGEAYGAPNLILYGTRILPP